MAGDPGVLRTGLTNARTEGYNRLVKQVKRVACGFRNTENSPPDTIPLPAPSGPASSISTASGARLTLKSPYKWLSIRSNDGTYRDRNFAHNWNMARSWLDSGRLRGLIVYCVYRRNWRDVLDTHRQMQGENHPDVVSMVDVESWGGQITGDNSDPMNRLVWASAIGAAPISTVVRGA